MTSYENAPATIMLATNCACCARPLVDAISVEAGVGPECRKRHGYGEAQEAADWDRAMITLDGLLPIERINPTVDPRDAANMIVHRIACEQAGEEVLALTEALRQLGFVKLAARITERLAPISVTASRDGYTVETPYNAAFVDALKASVPARSRSFDKTKKAWTVASSHKPQLWSALRAAFAGLTAHGPKGFFRI